MEVYLTEPQERFIFSEARHPALVAGYGAGKSQAAVMRILFKAMRYSNTPFAFVEPTFDLVRLIAWQRFEEILTNWGQPYKLNKSDSTLQLERNGAEIIFRSADSPERMVGFEVADTIIDEIDTLKQAQAQDVWVKMLARTRKKKIDGSINTVGCVSTPEGFKWLYDNFGKQQREGYELIKAPTSSNPYLPEGYIETLKATYPSNLLEAYLDGEFVNLTSGSVYHEFDRILNGTNAEMMNGEPLHIGLDFNVQNMSAVVWVMRNGLPHAVDELTGIFDTPAMVRVLQERYRGHQITVYPDASGGSRKTNNASESDLTILRGGRFVVLSNPSNPAVRDRILAMNSLINSNGIRKLFVNSDKCPMLVEALEKQAYDKNGEPDKSSGLDHVIDAAGYCIAYRFPVRNRVEGARVWVR